jgi:hypothetical protein
VYTLPKAAAVASLYSCPLCVRYAFSPKYSVSKSVVVPSHALGVKIGVSRSVKPRPSKKSRIAFWVRALTLSTANCFLLRSHKCRLSRRNALPCSLGVIGNSPAICTTSKPCIDISWPPGARASARTGPQTRMDDSCVSFSSSANRSGPISGLKATTCMIPVPSRSIRKKSLPPDRAL